jgi:serine protease AprX
LSSIAAEHPRPLHNVVVAGACLLALFCVAALRPFAGPASSQDGAIATSAPVTPKLAALAQSDPGERVEVIVRMQPGASVAAVRSFVQAAGGHAGESIALINGFSARLGARDAQRLATQPGVIAVSLNGVTKPQSAPDQPNKLATAYNQSVNTPQVWNHATGKGVGVAVIDTGIAGDLPDFRRSADDHGSRVTVSAVVNPDAENAGDSYGHGTHVAGLIAGNGANRSASDPLRGKYAGAAPDAHLISIKASDEQGDATVLDAIFGLQFAVDHMDDYGIRVVNLSLESTTAESYLTDPLDAAVEAAWFKGLVVVAAAGNRGSDSDAVDYAPGNDPYAISVGAVNDQATKQTNDDFRADWSSRGTTQDGYAKPDLYAPGVRLYSNLAPGSAFTSACAACVSPDGEYIRAGGTSMSAPVVSGIVAALLEKHPSWTPDQVKGALVNNLRELPGGGDEVDALAAYNASKDELVSNQGLKPSKLIDTATGKVDWERSSWSRSSWSRSSWSRSSWSVATGELNAPWAQDSYTCACSYDDSAAVDPSRSSWSRSSWSRSSWSRSSWSRSSWSRSSWSRSSWSRSSWSRSSWSRSSWSRSSWSRSSWSRSSWSRSSWSAHWSD